jgi:transposase
MLRTFRYRLYPNQAQRTRIRKNIDACRFVYNWALGTTKAAHETDGSNLRWFDLNNRLIELKQDHPFLKDAYSQSLQQAAKRLHLAFQHFFQHLSQDKEQPNYPKFKRRKAHRQSLMYPSFSPSMLPLSAFGFQRLGRLRQSSIGGSQYAKNAYDCFDPYG